MTDPARGDSSAAELATAGAHEPSAASERWALAAFVGYLFVSFFAVILVFGRDRWFFLDEWTFLATRETGSPADYFEPVNGHWVTLPLLLWRGLFEVFGLHSYVPYQVPVILLHLTAAVLLRVVMRRAGVGPWIATAVAGSFVLLGTGADNIVWGFQITLVGSLVFGLGQLILADHDGDWDRRDGLALACGAAALLCSGAAIPMVAAVGLAVLLRRGWRAAALQTVPLAVMYGLWYLVYRPQSALLPDGLRLSGLADIGGRFAWNAVTGIFVALGHFPIVAAGLAAALVVGLALAWLPLDRDTFRRRAALPVGLLLGLVVAVVSTMLARAYIGGPEAARWSRYSHVFVALTLPALAVAADALTRRWRPLGVAVVALLVVAVPANLDAFDNPVFGKPFFEGSKQVVLGIGRTEEAAQVPASVRPQPNWLPGVTVGWLRDVDQSGQLPDAVDVDPTRASTWPLQLGLAFHDEPVPADLECERHTMPVGARPAVGRQFAIGDEPVGIVQVRDGVAVSRPYVVDPDWAGRVLSVELPDLEILFQPARGQEAFTLCR